MDSQIRLTIDRHEPFAGGMEFGDVGPYDRLIGRVEFAIDPLSPAYQSIVDIEYAPRDSSGRVTFSTDFFILKPSKLERGNRRLLYDVNNRGNKRLLRDFNDAPEYDADNTGNNPLSPEDAGNGFLMRYGYSIVCSGWQGDILPGNHRMTMRLPVATDGGQDITGVVRSELTAEQPTVVCLPLSGNDYTLSFPSTCLDTTTATLTCREHEADTRVPVPSDAWQFAKVDADGTTVPSPAHCYVPSGFKPGWLYELVYTAKQPLVMGLGFTGVRDLIAFLRYAEADSHGMPNPLRENAIGMDKAYAWGISQSGRFLREFVYQGYNADAQGRQVFEAISPDVSGGGRVALNNRFAQPGRYPRQHNDHLYPSDQFPFAYPVISDPLTGATDGILKRPPTDPYVIHTQASAEYWERRGSLVHTDTLGNDLQDHEKSRVYLFASAPHVPFPKPMASDVPLANSRNLLRTTPLLRALLVALDAWATDGTPPPASRVPKRDDASGVSADVVRQRFPTIPGVRFPATANRLYVQHFTREPPQENKQEEYAVLLPKIDEDGLEVAGIRTPDVEVPLATYTGWNLRATGCAERDQAGIMGSQFPLPATESERKAQGDPRASIAARYGSKAQYVRQVVLAAQRLVEQRLLLDEDAECYIDAAKNVECFDQ